MSLHADAQQQLDLRGLDPPEPMRRALEAVEALAVGAILEIVTDREPFAAPLRARRRAYGYLGDVRSHGFVTTVRRGDKGGPS